ncbi:unnamed protein product [Miscanthus lutarioriparius]|uniref:Uncharacterized protein n=1 Tax=Miscanthus lutarioriparius TaxID=422564 RepID=A0A811PF17_9POAL|nr:unnamed protein product [Miscanthus lutarioriparius]
MFELLVYMCFGARLSQGALDEIEALERHVLASFTAFPVFAFFPPLTKRLFRKRRATGADEGDRPLTDAEIVSLCSEFLNAGTDTTVTLVEWIMAELANNPGVQAKVYKVYKEVTRVKPDVLDDAGNLQSLPYLKAVVLEGLRLHPPAHFLIPHGLTIWLDERRGDRRLHGA